ncbi:MAG: glycosyltransferase family 9 protein [Chlamydiota bacterium]
MKKIAVVSASGIGDALIFQTAAHQLRMHGFEPTTFSDHLPSFGAWLQGASFAPQPHLDQIPEIFNCFDAIFLQHDNSAKARAIKKLPLPVYTFYGEHLLPNHDPWKSGFDFVCDLNFTMVDNLKTCLRTIFSLDDVTSDNGFKAPSSLVLRKHNRRVVLHPLSGAAHKNWTRSKFLKLAILLDAQGFEPIFASSPQERSEWGGPELNSLEALASLIYESGFFIGNDSGPGHIASLMGVPHLIIGWNRRQMSLWRPGWTRGALILPPRWIPNWKGFRLRESHWQKFITTKNVLNLFNRSVLSN